MSVLVVGTLLFVVGLVSTAMCVIGGVVELASLRNISAPLPRTFSRMITRATH